MSMVKNGTEIETNATSREVRQEHTDIYSTEWHDRLALTLDERGVIRDCNKSGEKLFGYRRHDLVWQHISNLLPQLLGVDLIQDGRVNPLLDYLCHCGHLFQVQNRQGDAIPSELCFVHLEHNGNRTLRLIVHPSCNL
jgi:PAS domain S-box-containing protein